MELIGHRGPLNAVAIAPDGTWLATSGSDQIVRIWDAATGQQSMELIGHRRSVQRAPFGNRGPVRAVAIASDGTWLATGGGDRVVRVWDAATGQQRLKLTGHSGSVDALAIALDNTWIATGSGDSTVRIWEASTGQQRLKLTGHTEGVASVSIAQRSADSVRPSRGLNAPGEGTFADLAEGSLRVRVLSDVGRSTR